MILLDRGLSSLQLAQPDRGFSFQSEGPLDMRMDPRQGLTAGEIVDDWDEGELADVLLRWGEEPRARTIARAIVAARPVGTTTRLAQIVAAAA